MRRSLTLLLVVALAAAACGDDDDVDSTATTEDETTTTVADDSTTTTAAEDTTTTSTTAAPGTTEAPDEGEPIDIFPYEGATLAVVGVEADDVLNVREGPGVDFDVLFTLSPTSMEATATGNNRQIGSGAIWAELTAGGQTGFANTAFLLQPGQVVDDTSRLYPAVADRPSAETMLDLGLLVAEEYATDEPESRVVVVDGPAVGDLGEVTVDVIGIGDDSVGGFRVHVFANEGTDDFTVRTVETQTMCSRGVTEDGLCT